MCVCPRGRGLLSQHALQVVSQQPCSKSPGGAIPACIAGGIPACLAAGLGGGGGSPGPHPKGKWRGIWSRPIAKGEIEGIWSRPTAKGEIEGDLVQAQPRGKLRGIWSRPTAKGEVEGDLVWGVPACGGVPALGGCLARGPVLGDACSVGGVPGGDGYCCRWYASYWNAFLLSKLFCAVKERQPPELIAKNTHWDMSPIRNRR